MKQMSEMTGWVCLWKHECVCRIGTASVSKDCRNYVLELGAVMTMVLLRSKGLKIYQTVTAKCALTSLLWSTVCCTWRNTDVAFFFLVAELKCLSVLAPWQVGLTVSQKRYQTSFHQYICNYLLIKNNACSRSCMSWCDDMLYFLVRCGDSVVSASCNRWVLRHLSRRKWPSLFHSESLINHLQWYTFPWYAGLLYPRGMFYRCLHLFVFWMWVIVK